MNLDCYEYVSGKTLFDFEFESIGPKGKIRKAIKYTIENASGVTFFNIAFGDVKISTEEMDDRSVSNNMDTYKVLSTVAMNILDFSTRFPDMLYYVKGSTKVRTRLYQMALSRNIEEIKKIFELYGEYNNTLERFVIGRNYDAFLFYRK